VVVLGCSAGEDRRHANRPSPPAAQRERKRLEARRLRAAELFAAGVRQAEVARQLGISAQAVSVWHRRFKAGGPEAPRSKGPSGTAPRLSDAQLAAANGFVGELWTVDRVALVIERLTGVRHHPAHVWALLRHRLGWTVQRPARRAAERDQAAIDQWVKDDWPRIKQTVSVCGPAVREDRCQAQASASQHDSQANWHRGCLRASCLPWCRRRPGPPPIGLISSLSDLKGP
jgi:transposase